MNRMALVIAAALAAGPAGAALPIFAAQCPGGLNVDADRTGAVYINGDRAAVKKFSEDGYEARGRGVAISIGVERGGPPSVMYTARHGAHGLCRVTAFTAGSAPQPHDQRPTHAERAGQGHFDATGTVPCAQHRGQPMGQCQFGVARDPGGSASLAITRPDGLKRVIFFERGRAVSADLSQADGSVTFRATKRGDLFLIQAGNERYEIPEAAVFGG